MEIRTEAAKRTFEAGIEWLEARSLSDHPGGMPAIIPVRPALPDRWPEPSQRIDHEGWSYRCNCEGLYHAWPTSPDSIERVLRPWMRLADDVVRRMMTSLDRRGGPLLTGLLIAVGHIGDAPDRIFFPAGISVPMQFSSRDDFEFVPIVALTAPNPLRALLVEMIRCHGYSGRIKEEEYLRMAGEGPFPEEGVTRYAPPGWTERIGSFESAFIASNGRRVKLFLESGYVAEPDYPIFKVTPEMISPDERWPAMLKRDHLLGVQSVKSPHAASEGVA